MNGPAATDAGGNAAAARLSRRLRSAQRDRRIPAVAVAVRRRGAPYWAGAVHAGDDTQFRLGSITKTFTAVLVLQCRDAGLLDLDDPLAEHLGVELPRGVTIRRALSHGAGLQREPAGEVWSGGELPDAAGLLGGLAAAEQVLPPGRRFHYSNLAYALLGEVVARTRQSSWEEALRTYLLEPLRLSRISVQPAEPHARASYVQPYSDVTSDEPHTDMAGVAPAAQLWAPAGELARWGAFLAAPEPAVLAPATVAEMCEVAVMADAQRWNLAFGLGLMLYRRGERVLIGHGGAMPGFLAGLAVDRETGVVAAVLTATGAGADAEALACELVEDVLDADPEPVAAWSPGGSPPDGVVHLLGRWWTEGMELTISWHGQLEARLAAAPAWREPAVFERLPDGPAGSDERWRTVSGREAGELLIVRRAGSHQAAREGPVTRLSWATYALTRTPDSFAELERQGAAAPDAHA